jgi:LysM repeat protein
MSSQSEPPRSRNKSREELLVDLAADSESTTPSNEAEDEKGNSETSIELEKSIPADRKNSLGNKSDNELEIKEDHFPMEHVVDARDTLDKVAAKYDTTPTRLAQYNKLASRFIFAGQVRFIFFLTLCKKHYLEHNNNNYGIIKLKILCWQVYFNIFFVFKLKENLNFSLNHFH